jgi:hypothetical protein
VGARGDRRVRQIPGLIAAAAKVVADRGQPTPTPTPTPVPEDDMATNGETIIAMIKAQNAVMEGLVDYVKAQHTTRRAEYLSLMFNVQQEDTRNDEEKARDAAAAEEARRRFETVEAKLDAAAVKLEEIDQQVEPPNLS